jgi:hypothetical protein
MEWIVGEIAEVRDAMGDMPVRVIHVAKDKVIVVPHVTQETPQGAMALDLAKLFNVDTSYAQMDFMPNHEEWINDVGDYKLIKRS